MGEQRVLIAYGTRYGSTGIIAREIADYLGARQVRVDVVDLKKGGVTNRLWDYSLIVVGSGVAMFSWVGRVKMFLRKCKKTDVPLVVYISAGTAIESPEQASERFLDKIISRIGIKPLFTQAIAPVIDFRPDTGVSPGTKKRLSGMVKTMAKDKFQANGLMDLRDKGEFDLFLKKISDHLQR